MSERSEFKRYRGDGTTRDGKPALTPNEPGRYLASPELAAAVNTMLAVEQPLLITGEAGTGKTRLADSVAAELELGEVLEFMVRSDHQGRDLLYEIDNLQRFYDAQVEDERARKRENYVRLGKLGEAIRSDAPRVVLIDEIDKAPRDFPNDLLSALDRMELLIPEIDVREKARHRPIVIITSNRESQLPDPSCGAASFITSSSPTRRCSTASCGSGWVLSISRRPCGPGSSTASWPCATSRGFRSGRRRARC
jgi:nucleoside-triphosphatase THEP1